MARIKSILRASLAAESKQENKVKVSEEAYNNFKDTVDKWEQEKHKHENQKQHEKYRRKQQRSSNGADLSGLVKPPLKKEPKPGTYFRGTLKQLAEEFEGNVPEMVKYMTLGQLTKYHPEGNMIYNIKKDNKLVFDGQKKECYE